MKRAISKTVRSICICSLLVLSCTPTGQKSTDTYSARGKPVTEEAETIKMGFLAPFSGTFGGIGPYIDDAIRFAVKEQNAKAGLLGKKIEIIRKDSGFQAGMAARSAKKLITDKKVDFFAAFEGSHSAIALNSVATQYKKIYINLASTSDSLQGEDFSRYAFRVCANNYALISGLAQFMATMPYRKYYIISPDYAHGHNSANTFKKQIKQHLPDAQIVGEDYHLLGKRKFGRIIDNIKAAKADAVFTGCVGVDLEALVRQARGKGLDAPFPFATTDYINPWNFSRKDLVGIFSAAEYTMLVDTPENKAMAAKYHKQHKSDESWEKRLDPRRGKVILGLQMVFAAIAKAGSLDPEKIIETLEGFRYKTPVGWWFMRKCDHQVMLPIFGMAIQAGPNPYYPATLYGPDIVSFSAEDTAIPATSDYNPRCP